MRLAFWSVVLQWSRLGIGALLFLVLARHLTLAEIGAFATAFAPIRLLQVVHKNGITDTAIIRDGATGPLLVLSLGLGLVFSCALALVGWALADPVGPLLMALSPIPMLHGLCAPAEGALRRDLRIRPLALRTLFAQATAAALALLALSLGSGAWSLVVFALGNAVLGTAVTLALAPPRAAPLPGLAQLISPLPEIARISLRDLAASGTLPLVQLLVAASLGLPAAGAFQIAARLLSLVDAVAISPIRYLALPRFRETAQGQALREVLLGSLRHTTLIALLIYPAALFSAPWLLPLALGADNAAATLPLMPAFCLLGLLSALAMPLNQALTATGHSRLALWRAVATLALSLSLAAPATLISLPAVATSLPLASAPVLLIYAFVALPRLGLNPRQGRPA